MPATEWVPATLAAISRYVAPFARDCASLTRILYQASVRPTSRSSTRNGERSGSFMALTGK
jgi:hypothetical protein